jgi:hypothetical protein
MSGGRGDCLPALREAIDDSDLLNEAMAHHAGSKELLTEMATANLDDPLYDAKVTFLADQVRHQIKEVEREMLPQVSRQTSTWWRWAQECSSEKKYRCGQWGIARSPDLALSRWWPDRVSPIEKPTPPQIVASP